MLLAAELDKSRHTAAGDQRKRPERKRNENDYRFHLAVLYGDGSAAQEQFDLTRYGNAPHGQRRARLRGADAEPNDATAQEIYELRAGGEPIGLATVYRTLALLNEQGVVDAFTHHPGEICYRLCGEGHHHHLTCGECHQRRRAGDCELEAWLERLALEHEFAISGHTVEVTGICADCR